MTWPTTITGWLTYLRRFRRRSQQDRILLAGLADIQARTLDIYSALTTTQTQAVPRVALSYEEVRDAAVKISEVVEGMVIPVDLDPELIEERAALRATLRAVQRQLFRLRLVAGIFLSRKVLPTETITRITRGVRSYRVRATDTLASIAATELQSRARWPELVALNDLTWPFIGSRDEYPAARIIEPGEELLLPAEPRGSVTTSTAPPSPADLFGVDIDLSSKRGQVSFVRGDVELIAGVSNIQQAVRHRVLTARGSLELHPDYGSNLYRWVGGQGVPELLRIALFDYLRAVLEDPRVEAINRRSGTLDATTLALTCEATVIGQEQPVRLNVIVPSIGGAA